jgi:hypothetical protein
MSDVMITVDGVKMPTPSSFTWELYDISASDSGRTEDTMMWKNRVGQKRKIQLGWKIKSWDETSKILQAFNPEYFEVRYPDMLDGTYETRTFYRSDPSAPVKMWLNDSRKYVEQLSFDIIER